MPNPSLQSLGYLPVSISTLGLTPALEFDLYIQHPGRAFAELYRDRTLPVQSADIARLRQTGIDHLYIRIEDAEAYRLYLTDKVLHDSRVSAAIRLKTLREVTRVAFEDALRTNDQDRLVSVAGNFGHDLTGMLAEQTPAFEELFKTLNHDYYTFTHACNVSTYCAVIAIRMGICDAIELAQMAAGALLHDIGKRHIPVQILNKTGKLTDKEWFMIREHPVSGFLELAGRQDLNNGQLMMVYQHHERLDGSGYPSGVKGDDIHPWAKICAVADVFDAMSCSRPYRPAMPLEEVRTHLRKFSGSKYDSDVVNCWTSEVEHAPASVCPLQPAPQHPDVEVSSLA